MICSKDNCRMVYLNARASRLAVFLIGRLFKTRESAVQPTSLYSILLAAAGQQSHRIINSRIQFFLIPSIEIPSDLGFLGEFSIRTRTILNIVYKRNLSILYWLLHHGWLSFQ